jgi:peptide-methionine (S)-S-oxide reductase
MHTTQITLGQSQLGHAQIALGGGCFWCVEAVFQRVRGVLGVESGYCNGTLPNPSYEQVCTGTTGHAEVVLVTYDPTVIATQELLHIFFGVHDATTLNRQGNDVGTQYRSGIYTTTPEQRADALQVMEDMQTQQPALRGRITTEVAALAGYTQGEAYHQNYYVTNPQAGYCAFVVAPKVEKFLSTYRSFVAE